MSTKSLDIQLSLENGKSQPHAAAIPCDNSGLEQSVEGLLLLPLDRAQTLSLASVSVTLSMMWINVLLTLPEWLLEVYLSWLLLT